ncbi:hypothetical protein BDR04DRAFT_115582 [Suillus decipiens]|nr:hypothetical protein BDR04DRAFT_115582 [Suillus decipiens]
MIIKGQLLCSSNFTQQVSPPADVITYRFNNQMIYVPPAESFDQAVTFARSAFENDLTGIDKSRISFSLNVLANGKQSSVGISRVAWSRIMSHLARYEIIDVLDCGMILDTLGVVLIFSSYPIPERRRCLMHTCMPHTSSKSIVLYSGQAILHLIRVTDRDIFLLYQFISENE